MSRRLPPLNALRAFEAAARRSSFKDAATELHVTPAAVSHQVKALEAGLGVTLFRRLPRGLVLTEAGRRYLPPLSKGFDQLAKAGQSLREQTPSGRLTLNVLPSFGNWWLVPRLQEFRDRHPEIHHAIFFEEKTADFATGRYEIGIRYGLGHYPGLRTWLLMTEEVFPVCAPSLLNAPHPLRTQADLRHHVLLHDCAAMEAEPSITWERWLADAGLGDIDPLAGPAFSDSTAILATAMEGQGVAIGRSALAAHYLASGRLIRPFPESRPADFAYWIVAPEAIADEPKIQVFVDWILEAAGRPDSGGTPGPGTPLAPGERAAFARPDGAIPGH